MLEKVNVKLDIFFYVTLEADEADDVVKMKEEFLTTLRNTFGAAEMSETGGSMNAEGFRVNFKIGLNKTLEAQKVLGSIPAMFEGKLKLFRGKISEKFFIPST